MAFMNQFGQQPMPTRAGSVFDLLSRVKAVGGNDPLSAVQRMASDGVMCSLPDGRMIPVSDMLSMAQGKSAQQLLQDLGI